MDEAIIIAIRGIGAGALYALIAMSLNLIFNATGVLNFAQGQLLVVAGVFTYLWSPGGLGPGSIQWWLAMVAVVAIVAAIAGVQGLLTLVPMRSAADQHSWIMTTIAASIIMGAILVLVIGPRTVTVENHFSSVAVVGSRVPAVYFVLMALAVAVWAGLRRYQKSTLNGLALNALSQDLDAARGAGVFTMRLQILSFVIAGGITALTGFVGGHVVEVSESQALHYVVFGFIVAVIGGIGNNTGALVAGPMFGVLLMYASFEFGGGTQIPVAMLAIVGVLMLKPQGLLGRSHARRV
ncbi:MAG: branched-chain amino acid transporter permease [Marmoricola sp.]|nr:branched-chain amino acid transporter permease [Marmoricola sp.]